MYLGGMMVAIANSKKEAIAILRDGEKDGLFSELMPLDEDFGDCEIFEIVHGFQITEFYSLEG